MKLRSPALLLLASACNEYGVDGLGDGAAGVGPDIAVEPTVLDFGAQAAGTTVTRQLRVMETGFAPLTVHDVSVDRPGGFSVSAVEPLWIDVGQAALIDVSYVPTTDNDVVDLILASDDPDEPTLRVPLHGMTAAGAVRWEPNPADLGQVPARTTGIGVVELVNDGPVPVTVDGLITMGAEFLLPEPPALPFVVLPGTRVPVEVGFAPEEVDTESTGEILAQTDLPTSLVRGALIGQSGPTLTNDHALVFEVTYKIADVAFLLDTTCSMSGLATSMASEYAAIASDVTAEIPDITFGVATYDDYNFSTYGSGLDKPFQLLQQQTTDTAVVQAALGNVTIHGGGDGPESSMEALYQALTGDGYDQDCNGAYDSVDDVPPFVAAVGDAFGGVVAGNHDPAVIGTGELGGMGFREDTLPIVIYATDNELRDAEAGYGSPGGCALDAGESDVVAATADRGARLIAIGVNVTPGEAAWTQMLDLAAATGSSGDMDGDGLEEPAVVTWSGTSLDFRNIVADAIIGMSSTGTIPEVRLEEVSDPDDVVLTIDPSSYTDVPGGTELAFSLQVVGNVLASPTETSSTAVLRLTDGTRTLEIHVLHVEPW